LYFYFKKNLVIEDLPQNLQFHIFSILISLLGNKLVYKGKQETKNALKQKTFQILFKESCMCFLFPFLPLKNIYENRKSQPPQPQSKIQTTIQTQQEVCHIVALPFTLKSIKAKEELWKLKYFTMQKYNFQKIL